MQPPGARPIRNRFWFISCLLFIALLTGGALLVLYITQPADEIPFWFPIAGMILVGTPWLFWIMMCIYRSIAVRKNDVERPPAVRAAAVAPAGGTDVATTTDSPVDSPGGARRVRFGNATVIGSDVAGEVGSSGETPQGNEADGEHAHGGTGSSVSGDDGSSLRLHESEVPLALSMS